MLRSLPATLSRGVGWKLAADLLGRLLQYALIWLAARNMAQADFGDFSFALSVGYMLAQIADFGLQLYVQRELARLAIPGATSRPFFADEQAAGTLIGAGLIIKGALSLVALGAMAVLVGAEPLGNKGALLALGLAMVLAGYLGYFAYCFRALRRLQEEALAIILARGANLLLGSTLLLLGGGVWGLALAANVAMLAGVLFAYRRLSGYVVVCWRVDWAEWRGRMWQPLALGFGVVLSMLAFRIDNLLIPPLLGREALGAYNAAYKLFEPSLLLPALVLAVTFPLLSQAATANSAPAEKSLRLALGQTMLPLLGLALPASIGLFMLAEPLISVLYGAPFAASTPVLQVLALACLPMFLNYGLTHALIAMDKTRLYAAFMLLALLANVAGNLALVPAIGIIGAALTTVGTELVLFAVCLVAVLRCMAERATSPGSPQLLGASVEGSL